MIQGVFLSPVQLEVIIQRSYKRIVVRNNRNVVYINTFEEGVPQFNGSYYMGGVPEQKMPEK